MMPPGPPNGSPPVQVADWIARSGISIVFSVALLWWVLAEQSRALEKIATGQAALAASIERVTLRLDAGCVPVGPPSSIR